MLDWLINFLNTYVVKFAVDLVIAALILLVGLRLVRFFLTHLEKRKGFLKLDSNIAALILNSLKIVLNALIIIVAIQVLGVPSATIVAVIGSCGLAVGLALQGGLSNLAGGVMIMIFKPFHSGDYICTAEGDGFVESIGIFYTTLLTFDRRSIHIPNSLLSSKTVTNFFAKEVRGVDLELSVAYGSDLDRARETLLACARANPLVLEEPISKVFVSEHSDSCVKLVLRAFVKSPDYWQVRCELLESTLRELAAAGVEIPFPQLDVHLRPSAAEPAAEPSAEEK